MEKLKVLNYRLSIYMYHFSIDTNEHSMAEPIMYEAKGFPLSKPPLGSGVLVCLEESGVTVASGRMPGLLLDFMRTQLTRRQCQTGWRK